jgi:hypothetical protein
MSGWKLSRHDAAREVSHLVAGLYYLSFPPLTSVVQKSKPTMFDVWEEAALEAAVEVVEEDPQLAEYEAWEEAALLAPVDAFAADEQKVLEAGRRHWEAGRRHQEAERQHQWEVRRQQGWEQLVLRQEMR